MIKKIVITLFFLATLNLSSFACEELLIVGDSNSPPRNWLDADGIPQGIIVELLKEVSNRTSIEFRYNLVPWKRALSLSKHGEAAIIGFSKNKDRELIWHYSSPMYFSEIVIVTTKEKEFVFKGLESLKGRRLAIKQGARYSDDFERARSQNVFSVIETVNRAGQIRMLAADRVDAVFLSSGRVALEAIINENEWLQQNRDQFIILEPPYKRDPNYLGIPKSMGKEHLIEPISKALEDMREDGVHQRIIDKVIDGFLAKNTQGN